MSFVQRDINVTVQLGTGAFGEAGFDTVELKGYRASVNIEVLGMPSLNRAQIRVWGVQQAPAPGTPAEQRTSASLNLINKMSQLGLLAKEDRRNLVSVTAGDAESGMALVFSGGITTAWPDFRGAPDVSFNISALTAALDKVKPVQPTSYPGPTKVADIMRHLADVMGYSFENNGVDVVLSSPYFPGTALDQMHAAAIAANIYAYIADDGRTLVILPKNGHRRVQSADVSVETGLVGYPQYFAPGQVSFRTLYNPAIRFAGLVNLQSVITPCCGVWKVMKLTHNLESQVPNGDWFTDVLATRLKEAVQGSGIKNVVN